MKRGHHVLLERTIMCDGVIVLSDFFIALRSVLKESKCRMRINVFNFERNFSLFVNG